MSDLKQVRLVGLEPSVVDYTKYPGLTAEKLRVALEGDKARLIELGYRADLCFIDLGRTAEVSSLNNS